MADHETAHLGRLHSETDETVRHESLSETVETVRHESLSETVETVRGPPG